MRFTTPFTTIALLTTYALAAPALRRDTNSDNVATLESASTQLANTLSSANTQMAATIPTTSDPSGGGIIPTAIQNLINNFEEAIALFENIASQDPSTADASAMAQSMQAEIKSLQTDVASTQSTVSSADAASSVPSLSVDGINTLLGTLVPGVSDVFNEVADTIENLGLPSLP